MSRRHVISGVAALVAVVAIGSTAIPAVNAASTVTIRQADLITALSATKSAGHVSFRADGLHVWTDDATSNAKAAEYFAVTGPDPDQRVAGLDRHGRLVRASRSSSTWTASPATATTGTSWSASRSTTATGG